MHKRPRFLDIDSVMRANHVEIFNANRHTFVSSQEINSIREEAKEFWEKTPLLEARSIIIESICPEVSLQYRRLTHITKFLSNIIRF